MNFKPTLAASLLAAATLVLSTAQAAGPVSLTDAGYSQNFDTLPRGILPSYAWSNGQTLEGWYVFSETGAAITTIRVSDGSSSSFGVYSVGNSTDRALGSIGLSGTIVSGFTGYIALALTNNTGRTLDEFDLLYDSEQWRFGAIADITRLSYRVGTNYAPTGWTSPGAAFNATAKVTSGSARALNGNADANRRADVGGTISLTWAAGDTLWVRWSDLFPVPNNAQALMAIDNVRITVPAAPIPEAETWAMLLAGLATLGCVVRRRQGA